MDSCPVCKSSSISDLDAHFRYHHPEEYRKLKRHHEENGSGDFLISAVIGAATGSALLGAVLGGDLLGGIVGDLFSGD